MNVLYLSDIAQMSRERAESEIRSRVRVVPLGDGLVLARVLGHTKIFLSTDDFGLSCHLMLDGYWESWLTLFLARTLRPGMHVIDVGANYGYYSVLMGLGVGPTGRLLAVEPNPVVATILDRSLQINGYSPFSTVAAVAAGADDGGLATLFVPRHEPKNATIVSDGFASPDGDTVQIPIRSIDALTADWPRVDLVKIDAEGAEETLIAGMRETIERRRPDMVLEFNAARYADPAAFLAALADVYGPPRLLGYDGALAKVERSAILSENFDQDKLLYFSSK